MASTRKEQIRNRLLELRRAHSTSITSLRNSIEARTTERRAVGDLVDDIQQSSETGVEAMLASGHHDNIVKIDEALRDLELGIYGKCRQCSAEISAERLQALPFARNCRNCQEQAEHENTVTGRMRPPTFGVFR